MESRCSREAVVEALKEKGPLLVAYSGVDSALLTALAVQTLGKDRVRCVLRDSPDTGAGTWTRCYEDRRL